MTIAGVSVCFKATANLRTVRIAHYILMGERRTERASLVWIRNLWVEDSIRRRQLRYVSNEAPVQLKVGVVVPTGFEPVFKP